MNKVRVVILLIFGLLIVALLTQNGELAWMALPFLTYLGIGVLQSPSLENIKLRAARSVKKNETDGIPSVQVNVTVCNQGAAPIHLCLTDPPQPRMSVTDGQTQQVVALRVGEETTLQYAFRARRGRFAWKTIQTVVSDPLGLIATRLELEAAAEIQVSPELNRSRPFPLRPQRTLPSAGSIPARLGGSGTDFWGVREYHPGDPLRRLDWRRTARHPRQFFTKEFEQEEIADIGLILDARPKTDLSVGEDSLFEHSVRATASLAEVLLRHGNRVSLLIYGKHIVTLFPGYGKMQLNRILHTLSQATTEADDGLDSLQVTPGNDWHGRVSKREADSLDSLQFIPVQMFSSHSFILVLSPLAPDDWRLFPRLRAYGYQVLLISPDPVDYARRVLPTDPVTHLAARLTQVERHLEIGKITRLWIPVIDWRIDQPLAPLVRTALRQLHIQQGR